MIARRLLGIVLAGGASRRFGSDKAAALLDGIALADHAAAALAPFAGTVAVAGRTIPDRPAPGLGPLGGICGALHHAGMLGFDAILTIGCDTPIVPVGALAALVACDGPACLDDSPVVGCWPIGLLAALEDRLRAGGDRSMRGWCAEIGAITIDAGPIANVNRPGDLARLHR